MFVVERQEFALFLARSVLLGMTLAGVYLLLGGLRMPLQRAFRGVIRGVLLLFPDLAFSALVAFSNVLMVYASNRGQVRLSALLLELIGFCAVYIPLASPIEKAEGAALDFLKNKILIPILNRMKALVASCRRRIQERFFHLKVKKYNSKVDRLLQKTVRKALEKGETFLFPEK